MSDYDFTPLLWAGLILIVGGIAFGVLVTWAVMR